MDKNKPRVLTFNEANDEIQNSVIIWVEVKRIGLIVGLRKSEYYEMQNGEIFGFDDLMNPRIAERYGKDFRMWSTLPTRKQMETMPWEGMDKYYEKDLGTTKADGSCRADCYADEIRQP